MISSYSPFSALLSYSSSVSLSFHLQRVNCTIACLPLNRAAFPTSYRTMSSLILHPSTHTPKWSNSRCLYNCPPIPPWFMLIDLSRSPISTIVPILVSEHHSSVISPYWELLPSSFFISCVFSYFYGWWLPSQHYATRRIVFHHKWSHGPFKFALVSTFGSSSTITVSQLPQCHLKR